MSLEIVLAAVLAVTVAGNACLGVAVLATRRRTLAPAVLDRALRPAPSEPRTAAVLDRDGGLLLAAPARSGERPNQGTDEPEPSADDAAVVSIAPTRSVSAHTEPGDTSSPRGERFVTRPADLLDPQTGLAGSVAWERYLRDESSRVERYRRPAAVVVAELWGLGRLEARFGPAQADRLLPSIADVFRREARRCDRVARIGHARFAVLLPETTEEQAVNYVERVRRVADRWLDEGAVAVRLAIGIASPGPSGSLDAALRTAEARMYDEARGSRPEVD